MLKFTQSKETTQREKDLLKSVKVSVYYFSLWPVAVPY